MADYQLDNSAVMADVEWQDLGIISKFNIELHAVEAER